MSSDNMNDLFKKFWENDAVRAFTRYGPGAFTGMGMDEASPKTAETNVEASSPPDHSEGKQNQTDSPKQPYGAHPWFGQAGAPGNMSPFPMPFNPMNMFGPLMGGAPWGAGPPGAGPGPFPFPPPPWFPHTGGLFHWPFSRPTTPDAPDSGTESGHADSDGSADGTAASNGSEQGNTDAGSGGPFAHMGNIPDEIKREWMILHKRMLEAMEHYLAHFNSTDDTWLQQMMKAQFQFFVQMAKRHRQDQDQWVQKQREWLAGTIAEMESAIADIDQQDEDKQ